jgi:hypothetical protein
MISAEEFEALKKRIDSLESSVARLAVSYKDVLEKYPPEAVNGLNTFIGKVTASQTDAERFVIGLTNKMTEVAAGVGTLAMAVDRIQEELEFRAG